MRRPKYRLSPNEVERLVKEERDRLRKLRIVQVREQAKANAALIRSQVRNEKERLWADFANDVKDEILAEKEEKIRKLEQKYDSTLRSIGQGHKEALLQGDGQKIAERLHKRLENEEKAMGRFNIAIEKHERDKAQQEWESSRNIRNRNLALEIESKRAAFIASLPPPPSDDIDVDDKPTQKKAIPMTDMKSFAATHYHIPDFQVVKAGPDEQLYDAKVQAEQTDIRLKQDLKEKKRSLHEQVEKARIRGNEALHKEMLKHDLSDMMKDLSLLQRKDRRRRQNLVAEMPNQVFVPPERCLQDKADQQVDMERQFEEMYINNQPRSDPSTFQTWSEFPSGDDTVTNDSELSTLESVPLPPSEMALRDMTSVSKMSTDQKHSKSKESDSMLRQLLNKIKEQRMNVQANQRQESVAGLTNQKSGREGDNASMVSAENQVRSKRLEENNIQGSGRDVLSSKDLIWNGREDEVRSEDTDSKSSGSKILSQNNALIEELQCRIQQIENQKLQLGEQLQSQSEFYMQLQKQQQELQSLRTAPRGVQTTASNVVVVNDSYDKEPTLEDVSIPGRSDSHFDVFDYKSSPEIKSYGRGVQILPSKDEALIDLAMATSKLRPVAGIFKGTMNPQFELLTSNGFLPSPVDVNTNVDSQGVMGDFVGNGNAAMGSWVRQELEKRNVLQLDNNNSVVKEGGARRMIDFGGRDLKKADSSGGDVSGRSDAETDTSTNSGYPPISKQTAFKSLADTEINNVVDDPMKKKLQEYHDRAQELHASMDETTLNKVRDYQQHILQTHQDRKQLLSNIRDDIERRRQALYTTSKFVGTGGAFLMNLGGTGAAGSGGGHIAGLSSSVSSSYPTLSSGVDSRPSLMTGSLSERVLQPIKPFIADSWLGTNTKTQSILKPSSQFGAPLTQIDLSKAGTESGQEVPLPPSSVDRIRKSLAFDDLDSNIDTTSPAGFNNFNDTPASRQSQTLTDDSKITSSEEDRGSPILHGSRSDRWDTSDKSNNSVTGSSSLNGSALVARAEERREGFERRQQELRTQLMDIQHQKESILQRYYKGQHALQEQQQAVRHKLAFADASHTHSISQGQDQASTSGHQSFSTADMSGESEPGYEMMNPKSHDVDYRKLLPDDAIARVSSIDDPIESCSLKLSQFQKTSGSERGSRGSSGSGRSSAGVGSGGSFNLTRDPFLEEISYHHLEGSSDIGGMGDVKFQQEHDQGLTSWSSLSQRKSGSDFSGGPVVPSSLTESIEERYLNYPGMDGGKDQGASFTTWASLLSSGHSITKPVDISSTHSKNLSSLGDSSIGSLLDDDDEGKEDNINNIISISVPTKGSVEQTAASTSQTPLYSLYQHQPHELSTIIEVDTPTATSSFAGSSLRLASASQSVQSLVSYPSARSYPPQQYSHSSSDIHVDAFPDLPQILPVSTSGSSVVLPGHSGGGRRSYNLSTGEMATASNFGQDERGEADGIALTEVSLGAISSYTLESVPADFESGLDTSSGFNLSQ